MGFNEEMMAKRLREFANEAAHSDDICTECGHRRGYHDYAGCTDQLPNGDPCPCTVRVLEGTPIEEERRSEGG